MQSPLRIIWVEYCTIYLMGEKTCFEFFIIVQVDCGRKPTDCLNAGANPMQVNFDFTTTSMMLPSSCSQFPLAWLCSTPSIRPPLISSLSSPSHPFSLPGSERMRVLVAQLLVGSARRQTLALAPQNTDSKWSFLFEMSEWSMPGGGSLCQIPKDTQDRVRYREWLKCTNVHKYPPSTTRSRPCIHQLRSNTLPRR